jgi:microcompartment protein CcmL/EutN
MAIPNSRIIHAPGEDVLEILQHRMHPASRSKLENLRVDAIGLIQANIVNILYFADIAQKAAAVFPTELNGSCPQHIVTLALLGDESSVEAAMRAVEEAPKAPDAKGQ